MVAITFEKTSGLRSGGNGHEGHSPIRARSEHDLFIPSNNDVLSFGRSPLMQALHDVLTVIYWLGFAALGVGAVAFVGFVLLFVKLS